MIDCSTLIAQYDKVVETRLQHGPRNASASIQNEILHILGDCVRTFVCDGVREAGVYTLLVDETKDLSKKEQISISLRFVDNKAVIHEHFLSFVHATEVNAECLTKYIKDALQSFNLDPKCIVSQGYDGANVMSGKCSGVQQRLRTSVAPYAIYIHCYAHTLNLVLVDNIALASEFFVLAESLYVFVSTTKAHVIFMAKQRELHPNRSAATVIRHSLGVQIQRN